MSIFAFMIDARWRDSINFLVDVTGCSRYQAATLLAAAWNEGYLRGATYA
jgi:hypothetical protein